MTDRGNAAAGGMRVLDLGCGRGASSVFLHQEFDVQVWATDLWFGVDSFPYCGTDDLYLNYLARFVKPAYARHSPFRPAGT